MTGQELAVQLDKVGVEVNVRGHRRPILREVSLSVAQGEALGLVGESGSGKSMTARTIARLLPDRSRVTGTVLVGGQDVNALSGKQLRRHRARVGFVFQDPKGHINPVRSIGDFMTESMVVTQGLKPSVARTSAIRALNEVGISDAERRLDQFPHELSGGLLQRVMIATALLAEPALLLADEPTTALDVTTQAEVVAILDELRRERGLALIFITHDLDLASAVCDRTAVMYAGEIVEMGPSATMHEAARHPYTRALAAARPSMDDAVQRLAAIPGRPIAPSEAPIWCAFEPRCAFATAACIEVHPPLEPVAGGTARCVRAEELAAQWNAADADAASEGVGR